MCEETKLIGSVCHCLLDKNEHYWMQRRVTAHSRVKSERQVTVRCPDLKQILETSSEHAERKETASWNITVDHYHPIAHFPHFDTGSFLSHIFTTGVHSLFLYLDMLPPHSPSFQLAQAILNQTFTCINTLAISSQLLFMLMPSMKMELTECSKTSAHTKFGCWGISQKKEYNLL